MSAARRQAPITGLSHIQLLVTDVDKSAEWYAAALGLEPYARDGRIGYIALRQRRAGFVMVFTCRSGSGEQPDRALGDSDDAPTDGGSAGDALDHIAFSVQDEDGLQAWADHLTALGIAHEGVVLENGNPSLQLRDPDGIAIELVTNAN